MGGELGWAGPVAQAEPFDPKQTGATLPKPAGAVGHCPPPAALSGARSRPGQGMRHSRNGRGAPAPSLLQGHLGEEHCGPGSGYWHGNGATGRGGGSELLTEFNTHTEAGKVGSRPETGIRDWILPRIDGTPVFASTFRGRGLSRSEFHPTVSL